MHLKFGGLWRHPDFMRLWAGQTISVFGSMIGGTAMSFTAILFLDATPFQLGVLAAAALVPGLIAGLFAGAWVDRLRRRPILIGVDLGRAAVLATVPLAAFLQVLRIEQLYVVTFIISVLTIFFDVAYQSYLPTLICREDLVEGNSKVSASAAVAEFSGFSVAGWLVQLFTAPVAIAIDAISFVVSAVSVGLISAPEPAAMAAAERQSVRREIVEGLHEVLRNPLLRVTAVCSLIRNLSHGVYGALVVLYMSRGLGFEPGILTMFWAVGGISSLLGAISATRVTKRFGVGPTMIVGLLLSGISSLFIPLAEGATITAALLLIAAQLLGDGADTLYEINQVSLRQAIAPERLLGRVNASMQFVGLGAMLVGSLLGGLMGETIGVRATLVVGTCGTLLSAVWLIASPLRLLHLVPVLAPEPLVEN